MACTNNSILSLPIRDGNALGEIWGDVFGVLMAIVAFTSTTQNAVILITLCRYIILRTPSNKILISLILAYFLIGLIVCPLFSLELLYDFPKSVQGKYYQEVVWKIRAYVGIITCGASVLTHGFLCYERLLHLVQLHNYKMPDVKLFCYLILSWFIPVLLVITTDVYSVFLICKLGIVVILLVLLLISITFMVAMVIALKRHSKHHANVAHGTHMQKERRSARAAIIMVIIYVIMVVPFVVFYAILLSDIHAKLIYPKTYVFACLFCFCVSIVNPAYIAFHTVEIRRYIFKMFGITRLVNRSPRTTKSWSIESDIQMSRENSTKLQARLH